MALAKYNEDLEFRIEENFENKLQNARQCDYRPQETYKSHSTTTRPAKKYDKEIITNCKMYKSKIMKRIDLILYGVIDCKDILLLIENGWHRDNKSSTWSSSDTPENRKIAVKLFIKYSH